MELRHPRIIPELGTVFCWAVLVLAPVLNRWPLFRAVALTGETLSLGWFFSPGETKPASRKLFFVHIGPFFLAVFGGALGVGALRRWRSHPA